MDIIAELIIAALLFGVVVGIYCGATNGIDSANWRRKSDKWWNWYDGWRRKY